MTILSMPGKGHANRYFTFFCDSLEEAGMRVLNIRDRDARRFKFDVLHLHFPTHFLTETKVLPAIVWSLVLSAFFVFTKLLGKPIVYTVHNVIPFHAKRGWLLVPYLALVHHLSDAFVFLNGSSQTEFYERFPAQRSKRFVRIAHGPYPVNELSADARREKRRAVAGDEESFLVGFLGTIKSYKNAAAIASVPRTLGDGRPVKIVVAGRIEASYKREAEAILADVPADLLVRIDRFVSDEELDELIQITDAFFLPYTKGWNSGAVLLALSNRARIVASNLPVFEELAQSLGAPWVYCFDRDAARIAESLPAVLEAVAADPVDDAARARLSRFLDENSFAAGTRRLEALYSETRRTRGLRAVTP
jgi:glycosyltransferase involved in cell wall biosynthesis